MLEDSASTNVKILCCWSMKKSSFYLMINLLDLIFIGALTFQMDVSVQIEGYPTKDVSSKSYKMSGFLIWLLAAAALASYFMKNSYHTTVHRVYSIVRIIVSVLRVVIYSLGCLMILVVAATISSDLAGVIVLTAAVLIVFSALLIFEVVNLSWSFELKKIVFENAGGEAEPGKNGNLADARVPLESAQAGSPNAAPGPAKNAKERSGPKGDDNA